jgi:ADP-heptose:LPS heptosyltransferase
VLLGDKTKSSMAERLERRAQEHGAQKNGTLRVWNAVGKTDLRELIALIRQATVCMGPDSGPGHIAGAVGTPYVALFGPTPVTRNVPFGSEALALSSQIGCAPCKRRVCPGLGKVCMKLIHPQAVLAKVSEVVGRERAGSGL